MKYTNGTLAHSWIHGHEQNGEASNFYFRGRKIYSYDKHFCIANKINGDTILFNKNTYSNTTSHHQSYTLRAIPPSYNILYCDDPSASSKEEHRANYKAIIEQAKDIEKGLIKRRVTADTFTDDVRAINSLLQDAFEYSTLFKLGYKRRADFVPNVEAIKATQAANRKRKAKAKAKTLKRNNAAVKQWIKERDCSKVLVKNNDDIFIISQVDKGWSHTALATWVDQDTALVKVGQNIAMGDAVKFSVPYPEADRHNTNYQHLARAADDYVRSIRNSIKFEDFDRYKAAVKRANDSIDVVNAYQSKFYSDDERYTHETDDRAKFDQLLADHKAAIEEARLAKQVKREAWLNGEGNHSAYGLFDEVTLRIKGDKIETSQGVNFPADHAPIAWRMVAKCKENGEAWHANGHTIKLGFYQVDRIDMDGNLTAGCHYIEYSESRRIAVQLGLCEE